MLWKYAKGEDIFKIFHNSKNDNIIKFKIRVLIIYYK